MKTRRSNGRRITRAQLTAALDGSLGNISEIARRCGVDRVTIYRYLKQWDLMTALEDERERHLDTAEAVVNGIMIKGKDEKNRLKAAIFVLDRRGKLRGWAAKHELEHTGPGGGPVQVMPLPLPPAGVDLEEYARVVSAHLEGGGGDGDED